MATLRRDPAKVKGWHGARSFASPRSALCAPRAHQNPRTFSFDNAFLLAINHNAGWYTFLGLVEMRMSADQSSFASLIERIGCGLLTKDEVTQLAAASHVRRFDRGETIIKKGEVPPAVYILASGITRSFFVDASGKEVTDCIMGTPGLAVMPSARLDAPSPTSIEALTVVNLIAIDMACVSSLLETSLGVNKLYVAILQDAWEAHWEVEQVGRQYTARDRYLWFLEKFPGLDDAVPARHIASFLGMTPVTLSRLRSSLRGERGGE